MDEVPAAPASDLQAIQPAIAAADPSVASAAAATAPADLETAASDTVEGSGGGDLPAVPGGSSPSPTTAAAPPPNQIMPGTPAAATAAVPSSDPVPAPAPAPSFFSFPTSITSFFNRAFFGGAPTQNAPQNTGSRVSHLPSRRRSRQNTFFGAECTDRITLPCVVEDFIAAGMGSVPTCLPIHCGSTLCAAGVFPCRIESTVKPFGIGVHFGEVGVEHEKGSPEDNIGACLRFAQVNC